MTPITAPDGAIFALICLSISAPLVVGEDAELWLREQFLIDDTPGGVTELTPRGQAYLDMILATPLPVKIERWGDPRGIDAPPPAAPALDPVTIATAVALALKGNAVQVAPQRPAPAHPAAKPVTVVTTIPPGYLDVPDHWKALPAGQWPSELRNDADVRVIYRDGRVSAPRPAQAIIWLHTGGNDDVMAYSPTGNDTMIPVNSRPIN